MTALLRIRPLALVLFLFATFAAQAATNPPLQPSSQVAPEQGQTHPVPAVLAPSKDGAINAACGLEQVEKSLKKVKSEKKRKSLIQRFNSCVAVQEASRRPMSTMSAPLNIGIAPFDLSAPPPPPSPPAVGAEALGGSNQALADAGKVPPPAVAGPPRQQQYTAGEQLTGSAWGTPDACAIGTASQLAGKGILFVHRSLVLPQEATDDFGYRLGKRFLVYQVTITNAATDFQYSVSDIVVNLKPIFDHLHVPLLRADGSNDPVPASYQASSQDLLMLRGVPEKGQDYDPRNMTLHILQGVGAVGAGVSGLTPFSNVMGSAMANFNGAFLQAFTGIAPDHTSTQLNRLSDMAFTSNTLIGKLQTKTFAVFIPEQFVMSAKDQKTYWKDPRKVLQEAPFDQLNVCVDGILLVQAATTPDPVFSTTESNVAPGTPIALTDTDTAATIYFTQKGDTPTTNSSKYSSPIAVGALGDPPLTIEAFATSPNKSPSTTVTRTFTPANPAEKPILTCAADKKSATLAPATLNDVVFYTTDGTTPTRASKSITASTPITLTSPSEKITAIEVGNTTSFSQPATCP